MFPCKGEGTGGQEEGEMLHRGGNTCFLVKVGDAQDMSMGKSGCVDLWSEDGEAPVGFSESSMSEHQLSGHRETEFFVRILESEPLYS